jgi:hypothetical protein
MIKGFFDDSGKESDPINGILCLAGYIAFDHIWWSFIEQWRQLLIYHGISGLHMKELNNISKEKGWDNQKRDSVFADFSNVIKQSRLTGFAVAVDAKAWRSLPKERRVKFGDAQQFCFGRLLRGIVDRLAESGEVEIIFDRDYEFANSRLCLLQHLQNIDPRLGKTVASITFADSNLYYGLQAADILAAETRREMINRLEGRESTRKFKDLMHGLPHQQLSYSGHWWDAEYIKRELPLIEAQIEKLKVVQKLISCQVTR